MATKAICVPSGLNTTSQKFVFDTSIFFMFSTAIAFAPLINISNIKMLIPDEDILLIEQEL
jgi:hypothetical protein